MLKIESMMQSLVLLITLLFISASCSSADTNVTPIPPTKATISAPTPTTKPPVNAGTLNYQKYSKPPALIIDVNSAYTATILTNKGTITVNLFASEAPRTVNNFVFLSREGFYENVPFHRVIKGFMVQTGDPTGTGTGGPGYDFKDEPVSREYARGTLAMANAGPDTNGSQFFIMHQDSPFLPKNYTIFGEVVDGFDTLDEIANTPVTNNIRGEQSVPTMELRIKKVTIQ